MKKLLMLAMVIAMLLPGLARADGAWILWYGNGRGGNFNYNWERMDAFASSESCKVQQQIECQKRSSHLPNTRIDKSDCPRETTHHYSNGAFSINKWICLPESVDPRK